MRLAALTAIISAFAAAEPVAAETPVVATDLPILRSLVGAVAGTGDDVTAVFDGSVSPHDWSLRPSDARLLSSADLIVWMGPTLSPGLGRAIAAAAPDTPVLNLLDRADAPREVEYEDHEPEEDADADTHDHGPIDPHAWLDPLNAAGWLDDIAEALAAIDPDRADAYRANAIAAHRAILQASIRLEGAFTDRSPSYVVVHDAFGYFADRFGVPPLGALADSEAALPGTSRVAEFDAMVEATGARCLVGERGAIPRLAASLAERHHLRILETDLIGLSAKADADGYVSWLTDMANNLAECG